MEGRRGLVWRGDKDGYQISDKKGPIRQHLDWSVGSAETRWTPDGSYVVAQSFNHVRIIPTKRGANDIDIEVPYGVASFAVDHKFATVLIGNAILDIELATGIVRQPDGNLSHVGGIAPRNGQLITIADKLRVWRDGKVDRTLGDANELAGGDGTSPIALLDGGAAFWWDPDTDARESISGSRWLSEIYRAGNDLVLVSIDELFRVGPAGATRWMTLEGRIDSVDVKRGRIMLHHGDRTYVLDTKTKAAWSFVVADGLGSCDAALEVAFSPDGTRVAAYSDGGLVLFDAKNGKPIGRIEMTDLPVVHWSFLPNGDLVIASIQELVIWNAKTKTASGYMTTVDMMPTQIAVDTAGKELGVAYIDGRVLWADVAALRSNATVRPSTFTKIAACTSDKDKDKPATKPLRYDALVKPPSD
jgi:WD40 repeat protein